MEIWEERCCSRRKLHKESLTQLFIEFNLLMLILIIEALIFLPPQTFSGKNTLCKTIITTMMTIAMIMKKIMCFLAVELQMLQQKKPTNINCPGGWFFSFFFLTDDVGYLFSLLTKRLMERGNMSVFFLTSFIFPCHCGYCSFFIIFVIFSKFTENTNKINDKIHIFLYDKKSK